MDLEDPTFNCTVDDFPRNLTSATGGMIGHEPFICGGYEYVDRSYNYSTACYVLQANGAWKEDTVAILNNPRPAFLGRGSVVLNNKLILAGGADYNYRTHLELAAPNTKAIVSTIKLPSIGTSYCIVKWNEDTFMMIGGGGSTGKWRNDTYFVNLANKTVTRGPDLLYWRMGNACHTINVKNQEYIVVGGGIAEDAEGKRTTITEYLQKSNYKAGWKAGECQT